MLQVGFGVGDITPDVGMNMPGGFFPYPGKGVRDHRLLAVACVVSDGTNTVALVGIDALFVSRRIVDEARRVILKKTSIPVDNVLIGANHTHTGGPVVSALGTDEDPKYLVRVTRAIAEAVEQGWTSLHASEIGVGVGSEPAIAFNRRFVMRDGREITHPGKPGTPHNKDVVCPAGPTDPEVGVLAVRAGGKVAGVVVHFGCHSTVVGGNLFSPDYAGYLRQHLRAVYGSTLPVCFLLGPCGDITQVDNQSTSVDFGPEVADMMGRKLASEATRVIRRMAWLKDAPVAAVVEKVPCAIRAEPDAARERPPFGLGSDESKEQKVNEKYAQERRLVAEERKKSPILACEVQGIRIGPLGIATNGAEYFCEYGLRIKKASRHPVTWVSTLTNECIGYVPTPQAFVAGGYEPRTARSSKLAPEAGQQLVEGALKALGRLLPAKEDK